MCYFLRAETQQEMNDALLAAEVVEWQPTGESLGDPLHLVAKRGFTVDFIGEVYRPTGEVEVVEIDDTTEQRPVMAAIPGYHANLLGDLTQEQLALLPVIEDPNNPVRMFWT